MWIGNRLADWVWLHVEVFHRNHKTRRRRLRTGRKWNHAGMGVVSSVAFIATHALRVAAEVPSETTSDELLHKLRDLESIGIGKDKESVHESFLKNVLFKDGRYHVDLPLKERHAFLPDNYDLSLARLNSVVRRPRRDPPMFQEYNRVIEEQLERGIIEKVDDTECQPPGQTQ